MRIFLTGATGFIGSHTLRCLTASSDHEVAILVRPDSDVSRIRDLLSQVRVVTSDLDRPSNLGPKLERFRPDAVVHLAWDGVLNSARNQAEQQTNISRALDLVRLTHGAGAKHWIGLGSQAEYGPCADRIDETTPTHPTTLYGAAKLTTCRQTQALCATLGMRYAWLRLFSAYGPHDDPSWLIPYIALKLLRGERPTTTAGEQRWDYVYVEDVAAAIVAILAAPAAQGIFNVGSGTTATIREIIEQVRDAIDPNAEIGFGEVPYRPDQVMRLEANITRLRAATGWQPRVSLVEGLSRTVAWCRSLQNRSMTDPSLHRAARAA
ncbi:MAG: NAD(P)-dependent oxidoreductase [Planctomycetia bacterium]|nr:NAD(P)-dependent oxidoreductase [Planctomycetia bacterium]